MAATLGTGDARPDAVAVLSPFARFTNMANGAWGCDGPSQQLVWGQSNDPANCAIGQQDPPVTGEYENGVNRYLPCPTIVVGYQITCETLYEEASPYDVVNQQLIYPPTTWIANGGGPNAGSSKPELAPLQAAIDFDNLINGHVTHLFFCIVNSTSHGTRLLDKICNGDPNTESVRQDLDLFLANNM